MTSKNCDGGTTNGRIQNRGLFRTVLAGPGRTLADAFANLERSPMSEHLSRHAKRDLLGVRVALGPEEGKGYWELTRIREDLYVIVENFAYEHKRIELVPGDGLIQFNFKVSGDMTLGVSHTEHMRFNRPSLLIWAQPTGIDISEWTSPSAYERNVAISMRPEFLVENFFPSMDQVPERLRRVAFNNREKVSFWQLNLTAQMFDLVTKLINNPYVGTLALVYAEALTLALLCSAVDSFNSLSNESSKEYTERQLRCLHAARNSLMREFAPAPTVRQLARTVGMAETTLSKGFLAVFGETIHDCSFRSRMQHALTLLRDQHASVATASEAVGYRHATSFATAFYRHFGVRPIDVKRLTLSV